MKRTPPESAEQFGDLQSAEGVLRALANVFFPGNEDAISGRAAGVEAERPDIKETYRILVEQIPAVVFMAYLDRGVGEAYVSPQIEAMLGFTQEEWLNDPVRWYEQIHPDDKARWSVDAANMLLTGQPLRSVYRVTSRDERVIWFHCEAKMVRNADGQPWFIHGAAFDITELKRTERALRESEQMLHGLFEFAPDTVVVVNNRGHIERVNVQVERMFGYKREELLGQSVEILLPERLRQDHTEHRSRYLKDPHTRPMGVGLDLYSRRKDGSEFPVDIMLSPMETPEGSMVIAVIRDHTNRKQFEDALRRSREELRALTANLLSAQDEERRRIARELHDGTAQNLAGLAMNLSLLRTTSPPLDANARKILMESMELADQCSRELRSLSYLLHPPLLDELGLATAVKSYVVGYSQRTGVRVELELTDLGRLSREVETTLFRIIQEGLANVHRHSGSSMAAIRVTLVDGDVLLVIEDRGSGYPARAVPERGAEPLELGVGIPGMRERAQQLGGRMDIDSGSGGTRVIVRLPLKENA